MRTVLMLLALSMIMRGSWKNEDGDFSVSYIISYIFAVIAWGLIVFGNVVE